MAFELKVVRHTVTGNRKSKFFYQIFVLTFRDNKRAKYNTVFRKERRKKFSPRFLPFILLISQSSHIEVNILQCQNIIQRKKKEKCCLLEKFASSNVSRLKGWAALCYPMRFFETNDNRKWEDWCFHIAATIFIEKLCLIGSTQKRKKIAPKKQ